MAGAGYKLFNTGDVLTAAQVNTYLMEQSVMVFADAAARTTALTGVVAEGMLSYLKDTNAVEVYDGANWVASDDPNAIQNTIVDAKGDLIAASADNVPARLAVGNNGETLVADSSASTGLRWQGDYAAGKNKIINGDFNINQRSFTSTTAAGITFGLDRWRNLATGGTVTYSAETFTLGTAPVAGYEAKSFARIATTGQSAASDRTLFGQQIESVRTLAGQTATVSFFAKAGSGTPKVAVELVQSFGTGGSPSSAVTTLAGQITLSTSWARYSVTVSVPSISGKTLGTANDDHLFIGLWTSAGTDWNSRTNSLGIQTATIDFWGVQVEAGSVATPFQTATGTLAGELAACQRYYIRFNDSTNSLIGNGTGISTTNAALTINLPVSMRVRPSSLEFTSLQVSDTATNTAVTSITSGIGNQSVQYINAAVASGLTQFRPYYLQQNGSTGYLAFSAEL